MPSLSDPTLRSPPRLPPPQHRRLAARVRSEFYDLQSLDDITYKHHEDAAVEGRRPSSESAPTTRLTRTTSFSPSRPRLLIDLGREIREREIAQASAAVSLLSPSPLLRS